MSKKPTTADAHLILATLRSAPRGGDAQSPQLVGG